MPKHDTSDKRNADEIRDMIAQSTPEELAEFEAAPDDDAKLAVAFRVFQRIYSPGGER